MAENSVVPEALITHTDQHEAAVQTSVTEELKRAGYPVRTHEVKPTGNADTLLGNIAEQLGGEVKDFRSYSEQTLGEMTGGSSNIRETSSRNPLKILQEKGAKAAEKLGSFMGKKAA